MAFIVDLFSTRTDKAIQIGNEEILRPLSIGTNWQKIRIGVRMGIHGRGKRGRRQLHHFRRLHRELRLEVESDN
jgi:hypothetical protein